MPVTLNSVLQVLIFLVIVLLITKPMGLYMTAIFSGRRTWLSPVFSPVERLFYRLCGVHPEEEQKWWELRHRHAGLQRGRVCCSLYLLERTQQWQPAFFNPQGIGNVEPQTCVQYRCQFHDQHQLAELRRRAGHDLPDADGGPGLSQLRLRRHRYCAGGGASTWPLAPQCAAPGQLLGRPDALCALPPAAHLDCGRTRAGLAGSHPELQPLHRSCTPSMARPKPSPRDRLPPRRSSKRWAPTVVASSIPTRRTRLKIPTLSRSMLNYSPSSPSERACSTCSARWWAIRVRAGCCGQLRPLSS